MSNVGNAIKRELVEMVPILIFFIAAFNLLVLTEALILRQYGIRVEAAISATIGALIIAKVVLITDHASITRRFQHRPLLHNVLWKTALYFVVSIAIRYAEHLIHFWRKTGSLAEANSKLLEEIVWPHALGVQIWLLILLLMFNAFRELARVLGRDRIVSLFLNEPAPSHTDHAAEHSDP